jgi:uncharacterized protein YbaR (Trm112 family)
MIDPAFLGMLVCPSSRQPLREATAAELAAVNRGIAAGAARTRGGTAVGTPLVAGLVPKSGEVIYPIVDGIPILLSAEAIPLSAPGTAT